MAIFSGRVVDAYYINPQYDMIEILFKNHADESIVNSHIISIHEDKVDLEALFEEGYDTEKLLDATAEMKRRSSFNYNTAIVNTAKKMADEMLEKEIKKLTAVLDQEKAKIVKNLEIEKAKIAEDIEKEKALHVRSVLEGERARINENIERELESRIGENLKKYEAAKEKLSDPAKFLGIIVENQDDEIWLFKTKMEIMKKFKEKTDPEYRRKISKAKNLFEVYGLAADLI